eukprot:364652-Chlamydomonas_euryale.AAC.6
MQCRVSHEPQKRQRDPRTCSSGPTDAPPARTWHHAFRTRRSAHGHPLHASLRPTVVEEAASTRTQLWLECGMTATRMPRCRSQVASKAHAVLREG